MEDLQSSEESAFVQEDVTALIKEVRLPSAGGCIVDGGPVFSH